jgi:ABC-type glycerol-3-phosphate transport system permease component
MGLPQDNLEHLSGLRGRDGGYWNRLMAVSTLMIIPLMLIFVFAQRVFIRGIVMTGSKGQVPAVHVRMA